MEKTLQLVMDKHMQNSHGFTMVETIFVLSIILILSGLTLTIHQPQKNNISLLSEIESFVNEARLKSMVHKKNVSIYFKSNKILYSTIDDEKEYPLPIDSRFESYELSYNGSGHITGAKTILFHHKDKEYKFVFQVGSGSFYVK